MVSKEEQNQNPNQVLNNIQNNLEIAEKNMEHIVVDYRGWGMHANKDRLAVMERVLTHIRKVLACIQEY